MSRSGLCSCDDVDNWEMIRWIGSLKSASRGKRGQEFFKAVLEALDAMPEKELIAGDLQTATGEVCAMGALAVHRGIKLDDVDPEDYDKVASLLNIATSLAREVAYMNDEYNDDKTPHERWVAMREWVMKQITPVESGGHDS